MDAFRTERLDNGPSCQRRWQLLLEAQDYTPVWHVQAARMGRGAARIAASSGFPCPRPARCQLAVKDEGLRSDQSLNWDAARALDPSHAAHVCVNHRAKILQPCSALFLLGNVALSRAMNISEHSGAFCIKVGHISIIAGLFPFFLPAKVNISHDSLLGDHPSQL